MSPSHHNNHRGLSCAAKGPFAVARAGFTLVELVFSMTILSFASVVLAGLMLAINGAWDHATALEDGRRQAQATISRIKWMVQQAGTYKTSGQSTMLGIAVLASDWSGYQAPGTLVIWSGGANGGMNAQGLQSRLPIASELVVYKTDSANPARLLEVTFPTNNTSIDFRSSSLATTVQTLLTSVSRQQVLLCDRIHVTPALGASSSAGDIHFELMNSPSDSSLAGVTVGSQQWNELPWGQGLVSADRGLRTTNIRLELMLDPDPQHPSMNGTLTTAIPYFGSVNRQYVYQP